MAAGRRGAVGGGAGELRCGGVGPEVARARHDPGRVEVCRRDWPGSSRADVSASVAALLDDLAERGATALLESGDAVFERAERG
jgi:predicted nucleic acid-binding Zn ribbon protein